MTISCLLNYYHLYYPTRGTPNTPFNRYVSSDYSDGKTLPRGGLEDSSLPNPRDISAVVHQGVENNVHESASLFVFQFGQFLDHDLTLTPEQELEC